MITKTTAEPGKWFLRLTHKGLGQTVDFTSVYPPRFATNRAGTLLTITVDENTYVLPVEGLQYAWKVYAPHEGEEPPLATIGEVQELP